MQAFRSYAYISVNDFYLYKWLYFRNSVVFCQHWRYGVNTVMQLSHGLAHVVACWGCVVMTWKGCGQTHGLIIMLCRCLQTCMFISFTVLIELLYWFKRSPYAFCIECWGFVEHRATLCIMRVCESECLEAHFMYVCEALHYTIYIMEVSLFAFKSNLFVDT